MLDEQVELFGGVNPLEVYFFDVFGLDFNLSKMEIPKDKGFYAFMIVPPQLNEAQIISVFFKKWGVNIFTHFDLMKLITQKIDRANEQKRPKGLYVFAHRGGINFDYKHQGKSYNTAKREGFLFMNLKEYLLVTGFFKFYNGYFINQGQDRRKKGQRDDGTYTSSLSGGRLIQVSWLNGIVINNSDPKVCCLDFGPREIVL